jgi:hypothetical protein
MNKPIDILEKLASGDDLDYLQTTYKKWGMFIDEVRTGYEYMIYEYINDISHRAGLDIFLLDKERDYVESMLSFFSELDNEFFDLTRSISVPIGEFGKTIWFRRAPRELTPHIIDEFKIYDIDLEKEYRDQKP